jgi:tripartite-type tricarboxylate transporter receptor subunit TctC
MRLDAASGLNRPIKGCKVQAIGVASDRRLPALPDVPTFIEQGIKGCTGSTWAGVLAPAGVPAGMVKRVSDEIAQIVKMPDTISKFDAMGVFASGSSPAEFGRFLREDIRKWGAAGAHPA